MRKSLIVGSILILVLPWYIFGTNRASLSPLPTSTYAKFETPYPTYQFASWAGCLIPLDARILIVSENEDRARESRLRLARVGHDHVVGYLAGGVLAWHEAYLRQHAVAPLAGEYRHFRNRISTFLPMILSALRFIYDANLFCHSAGAGPASEKRQLRF